jgi:hypothetical protein
MEVMPTPESEPAWGEDFRLATSDDIQQATNGDFELAIDSRAGTPVMRLIRYADDCAPRRLKEGSM